MVLKSQKSQKKSESLLLLLLLCYVRHRATLMSDYYFRFHTISLVTGVDFVLMVAINAV